MALELLSTTCQINQSPLTTLNLTEFDLSLLGMPQQCDPAAHRLRELELRLHGVVASSSLLHQADDVGEPIRSEALRGLRLDGSPFNG